MAAEPLTSLTLFDYDDAELLLVVVEETDEKTGYAATEDIAKAVGIEGDHPHQSVGGRLAYLHGIGATSYKQPAKWAVTEIGQEIINGTIKVPQARAIDDASDSELYLMVKRMAKAQRRTGGPAGPMIKRGWRRGIAT